jgi:hypothetical protein
MFSYGNGWKSLLTGAGLLVFLILFEIVLEKFFIVTNTVKNLLGVFAIVCFLVGALISLCAED